MALNREYFDAIHIDVVKKKYYNANKVEAILQDIRRQAETLYEENLTMKAQLESLNGSKYEIGEAVMSAQAIRRELVEKAEARAAEILAEAEQRREEMLADAQRLQEYAVQQVEGFYAAMRRQQEANLEALNSGWQEFLCGLFPAEAAAESSAPAAETPEDLTEKVGAIARELFAIHEE